MIITNRKKQKARRPIKPSQAVPSLRLKERSCATCRARKVRCTEARPACFQCMKSAEGRGADPTTVRCHFTNLEDVEAIRQLDAGIVPRCYAGDLLPATAGARRSVSHKGRPPTPLRRESCAALPRVRHTPMRPLFPFGPTTFVPPCAFPQLTSPPNLAPMSSDSSESLTPAPNVPENALSNSLPASASVSQVPTGLSFYYSHQRFPKCNDTASEFSDSSEAPSLVFEDSHSTYDDSDVSATPVSSPTSSTATLPCLDVQVPYLNVGSHPLTPSVQSVATPSYNLNQKHFFSQPHVTSRPIHCHTYFRELRRAPIGFWAGGPLSHDEVAGWTSLHLATRGYATSGDRASSN